MTSFPQCEEANKRQKRPVKAPFRFLAPTEIRQSSQKIWSEMNRPGTEQMQTGLGRDSFLAWNPLNWDGVLGDDFSLV